MKQFNTRPEGTALITALVCASIIAMVCALALAFIQPRYRSLHQAASWKESLLTAEGGVEIALNEIRKNLYDPTNAFSGWHISADATTSTALGQSSTSVALGTRTLESTALVRKGEGGQASRAYVTIDAPRSLVDQSNTQWYRIRSLGVTDVPGAGGIAGEGQDLKLRKFDLIYDRRTGRKIMQPQAGRLVEAIAKPVGVFNMAIFGAKSVDMTDQNIVVDSYDSRDANKSTNGVYDPAKRQSNGDIATNGELINTGGAHIYGDAFTNGGSVTKSQNVTGEVSNEFYKEMLPVQMPILPVDVGILASIQSGTTLNAAAGSPSTYRISSISLSGQSTLEIKGDPSGGLTYVQLVVLGDLRLSGQSIISLGPGVHLRLYVVGDIDITGQGIINPNSPLALQVYGIDRPKLADGTPSSYGTAKIAGNAGFRGTIYAPNYNIELKGGGTGDSIFGAFVGNTVRMTGVQSVHYDEALADGGLINDYKIVSWFEDER